MGKKGERIMLIKIGKEWINSERITRIYVIPFTYAPSLKEASSKASFDVYVGYEKNNREDSAFCRSCKTYREAAKVRDGLAKKLNAAQGFKIKEEE